MKRIVRCGVILMFALTPGVATESSERAKAAIAQVEKDLPDYEKKAEEVETSLEAFRASTNPAVMDAMNGARLRISVLRSVREIIRVAPETFVNNLSLRQVNSWMDGMDYYFECAKAGRDPFAGMTDGIRCFPSPIDGQMLFYTFALPKSYDPAKRYPLRVALHAGGGLVWRATWIKGKPGSSPKDASNGDFIQISPCGRGNNSYQGMGEIAVMDAIEDVKKHYSVDVDRVTVGGASMGGTGGFTLSAHYPDAFSAAHSLTGGAAYGGPRGNGRFDGYMLADNYAATPLCIWDATNEGHYKDNHAFSEEIRSLGAKYPDAYPFLEITDPKGGHGIIDKAFQNEGNAWIGQQVRDLFPKLVIYKSYCLRYDGAFWAHMDTVENPAKPARIEAEARDGGAIRVAVENIDRFHLDLVKELVGDGKSVEVSVNNGPALSAPAGKTAFFAIENGKWGVSEKRYPAGLIKKRGCSGPMMDVFMGEPVLFVYGTLQKTDRAERNAMADGAVIRLFGPCDGGRTLHTLFDRKADSEVSDADVRDKSLVLFGTPGQNAFLAKIEGKLPVKFVAGGVEISGKAYVGDGVGLFMVYPNPLNPDRYVLLLPENCSEYTAGCDIRTMPDYLVAKPKAGYGGNQVNRLAGGDFDARWRLSTAP